MAVFLTVVAVFLLLLASEIGWRKHWLANEVGRKFVHITVGSFVALWPFFLTWTEIRLLSLAFFAGVVISSQLKIFRAIHSVQRPTYGEVFFALSVGLLTLITHSKAIYAASIFQMSLADGFAAIIGTRYGRENKYHLLGHPKSVAGTSAFVVTSVVIFISYNLLHTPQAPLWAIPVGALLAAAIENVAVLGIDNIAVPLFVALLLSHV